MYGLACCSPKKHLQGEKNIFLLFSVHNQALCSLHQIDVTFLWKWEMSGVAEAGDINAEPWCIWTWTPSPADTERLISLSAASRLALKRLDKTKEKYILWCYSKHQNTSHQSWANLGLVIDFLYCKLALCRYSWYILLIFENVVFDCVGSVA